MQCAMLAIPVMAGASAIVAKRSGAAIRAWIYCRHWQMYVALVMSVVTSEAARKLTGNPLVFKLAYAILEIALA